MKKELIPTAIASAVLSVAMSGAALAADGNGQSLYKPHSAANGVGTSVVQSDNAANGGTATAGVNGKSLYKPHGAANGTGTNIARSNADESGGANATAMAGANGKSLYKPHSAANGVGTSIARPRAGENATANANAKAGAGMAGSNRQVVNVSRLIGQPVINSRGEPVGRMKTLIMDRSSGDVRYGVVSQNGQSYVVPWNQLKETANNQVQVDVNAAHLQSEFSAFEGAPGNRQTASVTNGGDHPFLNDRIPFMNDRME
ncbi:MAG TPA: PRC-barrel domain-containing protein [Gammaproteobacteria bacterium]|nr:PRC-barrel domain-containing protein [Gammaproteobacteria bacterium]